jgi:hypothetical protein
MPQPTRVLCFRVTNLDEVTLKRAATEVGIPVATLIREAVRLYVDDLYDEVNTFPVNTPCNTPRYRQS